MCPKSVHGESWLVLAIKSEHIALWQGFNRVQIPISHVSPGEAGETTCHDATGLGNVIDDYITGDAEGVVMTGKDRDALFTDYILAIEKGEIEAPMIRFMEGEHKYATVDDLYGSGHPPDSIVAGAMAYRASKDSGVRIL
jgi:hypothetical protein